MGKKRIASARLDDDVVPTQTAEVTETLGAEAQAVRESAKQILDRLESLPLWPSVLGLKNDSGHRGVDRLSPSVAVVESDARQQVVKGRPGMEGHSLAVYPHEIVGVALTEPIGPVARDSSSWCVRGHPFPTEGKLNDDLLP